MELKEFNDLPEFNDEEVAPEIRPYLLEVRSQRKCEIPKYPIVIGREKGKVFLCVPVRDVSRRHSKIFEREGVFYAQDLGSINGTFVNDKRIFDPVEIKEGDRIVIAITKDYPRGVREYIFKNDMAQQQAMELAQQKERDMILQAAGIATGAPKARKGVFLRHCQCYIEKKDLISMFRTNKRRRVPLDHIDIKKGTLHFLSLQPFQKHEVIDFSIEHPRLASAIKLSLQVMAVAKYKQHNITLHKTRIVKFADDAKAILQKKLELSPLVCYVTSKLKE